MREPRREAIKEGDNCLLPQIASDLIETECCETVLMYVGL